jgi:hypothetical protein
LPGDAARGRGNHGNGYGRGNNGDGHRCSDHRNWNRLRYDAEQHRRNPNRGRNHDYAERFGGGKQSEHSDGYAGRDDVARGHRKRHSGREHVQRHRRDGHHGDKLPAQVVSGSSFGFSKIRRRSGLAE